MKSLDDLTWNYPTILASGIGFTCDRGCFTHLFAGFHLKFEGDTIAKLANCYAMRTAHPRLA